MTRGDSGSDVGGRRTDQKLFKDLLNRSDPLEKKQNRDLFKIIINNLAVVKELEGVKFIVLKKKYQHFLKSSSDDGNDLQDEGGGEIEQKEMRENEKRHGEAPDEKKSEQKPASEGEADPSNSPPALSFIELALQRQKSTDFKVKKSLNFVMPLKSATDAQQHRHARSSSTDTSAPKRFALPLRMPAVIISSEAHEEVKKIKTPLQVHLNPASAAPGPPCSPKVKRRSCADSAGIISSPLIRRHCKSVQPAHEPRCADTVPLESSEHEWMVTSAAGRWALLYGLLLNDVTLAEKRDFISGFTALHWAAKCGNSEMLCKIIDLSREAGTRVDINSKSFSGYTPLHIAAIHGNEYVIGILVNEYGANCDVRDNSGKKAHHYLEQGASHSIRELLGGVKVARAEQRNTDDADTHKHSHTISRLFQPQTLNYRRKPKSRSSIASVTEDMCEG
ncbi:Ankyrin repeat domain-containing protein SOWAHA [Bagarius yarrelli]|uniref:Ankyrin repeat domain-containing protein SOWAHA n=1 Tax=Bagarius yarrelli TaxID=175774 RepID=A0A556VVK4_BAGYA|nr:Ankyrin repeat domain-containing protein SOWAHA [Bagarius yarrelli]